MSSLVLSCLVSSRLVSSRLVSSRLALILISPVLEPGAAVGPHRDLPNLKGNQGTAPVRSPNIMKQQQQTEITTTITIITIITVLPAARPENRPISSMYAPRSSRQQLRRPSTLKCFGKKLAIVAPREPRNKLR